tara:strand:- start:149 stop:349 length:201 start_codon:yes stop_codon:yes gene_type:complete
MIEDLRSGDIVIHPETNKVGVLIEKNIGTPCFWKVLAGDEVLVWFGANIKKIQDDSDIKIIKMIGE